MDMPQKTSFTYKLNDTQQILLMEHLRAGNYRFVSMPHTQYAAETDACRVALYNSGKCLVQGRGAQDFVTYILEPQIIGTVGLGYEKTLNPEAYSPHMGIDESGKGDFFGPLVIAAAYSDNDLTETMLKMGVKDSKNITSDKRAFELDDAIRKLLGKRFSVVTIGPEAYNRLYVQMRSVNAILAWGHARAIENMLGTIPDCPRAISDQFGDQALVKRSLMSKGRKIDLVQRHRAESDTAVAAASIIARAAFLRGLRKLGHAYDIQLPKGASAAVVEAGVKLAQAREPATLLRLAKVHFRTTDVVLEKLGLQRCVLGATGAVTSKPQRAFYGRKKPVPQKDA